MRMWSGRAFQVSGPACENARSPNFMRSRGREGYSLSRLMVDTGWMILIDRGVRVAAVRTWRWSTTTARCSRTTTSAPCFDCCVTTTTMFSARSNTTSSGLFLCFRRPSYRWARRHYMFSGCPSACACVMHRVDF